MPTHEEMIRLQADKHDLINANQFRSIVDYKHFIDEIKRIITSEGVIIFTTPNALLRLYPEMKPWDMFHVREFNHSDLKSLLDNCFTHVGIFGLFAIESLYPLCHNE